MEELEKSDFYSADIFISPPEDGNISAEDSDNDDFDLNHLAPEQLKAPAELRMKGGLGNVDIGKL